MKACITAVILRSWKKLPFKQITYIKMHNFKDSTYLKTGTTSQRIAYKALQSIGITRDLKAYDPILVGTIPLDIDTADSDLDIICEASDLKAFQDNIQTLYGKLKDFKVHQIIMDTHPTVLASFIAEGLEVEIFARNVPTEKQYGYCHMLAKHKLLQKYGKKARDAIRALKQRGLKTDQAFVEYLKLEGIPDEAVLAAAGSL